MKTEQCLLCPHPKPKLQGVAWIHPIEPDCPAHFRARWVALEPGASTRLGPACRGTASAGAATDVPLQARQQCFLLPGRCVANAC